VWGAQLWHSYIQPAARRLDPVKFALITAHCARSHPSSDASSALAMLNEIIEGKSRGDDHDQAKLLARLEAGAVHLRSGDSVTAKKMIVEAAEEVAALGEVEQTLESATHKVRAELFRVVGPVEKFHESLMMYLAYTPLEELALSVRPPLAVDLAVSALASSDVYSFADVLENPVMSHLGVDTETVVASAAAVESWLGELMRACDRGDIERTTSILSSHERDMERFPLLVAGKSALLSKVVLMALLEMAARRPPSERSLSFADVAEKCMIPETQVEWLVMRACSKDLLHATIDGVDRVVHVEYVRPRAIGREGTASLAAAVRGWVERTHEQVLIVEEGAGDIMG
jgi:26S proteasome regulatory subunit N9